MIKDGGREFSRRQPGTDENSGNSNSVLIKGIFARLVIRRHCYRRRHMIEEASVLVINQNQQGRFPERIICPKSVIDLGDQGLSIHNVCRGMLIILACSPVARLNEGTLGERILVTGQILPKYRHVMKVIDVIPELSQDQALRQSVVVDLPRNSLGFQPVVNRATWAQAAAKTSDRRSGMIVPAHA